MGLLNVRGKGGKMALRFRKSFKIAPGVKLNLNKKAPVLRLELVVPITRSIQKGNAPKVLEFPGLESVM